MSAPDPIALSASFDQLEFLGDRTPGGNSHNRWAAKVAGYRDGGVFVAHYAGASEWEHHGVGDEVVMVVEGETTMTLWIDGAEHKRRLGPLEMVIVPQGTWHRFDTPVGVKVMTVTPQPTDHRSDHPSLA